MRPGFCPRQQMPPTRMSRSTKWATCLYFSIIVTLILLSPIAFASPPDSSWVAGIYDGADGDDVVSLIYETAAAQVGAQSHMGPFPCRSEVLLGGIVNDFPGEIPTRIPRSPPVP